MDAGRVLLDLLIVVVAARLAAESAVRIRQPAVLLEIAIGIAIGPSALGLVSAGEMLHILGEIGAILLLFEVGRQMDLAELGRVGGASLRVAAIGVIVPMALGFVAMRLLGLDGNVALFLAAGITATSVGITARVFGDLRALTSVEARTVLGAAVVDDVAGLLVLTIVMRVASGDQIDAGSLAGIAGIAIGFVAVATLLGSFVAPRILDRLAARSRADGTVMAIGLVVALGFARVASAVRLAPIVGAFVAGLAVGRAKTAGELHRRLVPVGHFFIPIFFLTIGVDTNVRAFADPWVLGIAAVLSAVAIAGKLASGLGVSRSGGDRLLVGAGMIPRGEVGLIFAGLGLSSGVLDDRSYAALLLVVLVTTLIAPPWIRRRIERTRRSEVSLEEPERVIPSRVPEVARLLGSLSESLERPDLALVAALARNSCESGEAAAELARGIGLGDADARTIAFLVEERGLLPAAAARLDAGTEEQVLDLASYIGSRERAAALYLLAVAEEGLEPWERERLDELLALVLQALSHADLTGPSASDLAKLREVAVALELPQLSERELRQYLWAAPRRYLLAQSPETIARHIRMIETRPARSEVRLEADPADGEAWTVHVALLDRRGALASIAGAFAAHRIAVSDAQISTWRNGVAVDVFRVLAPTGIDWERVRRAIEGAVGHDLGGPPPVVEGEVTIDNLASPWQTIVEVHADDRAGLLARVASALARAGLDIHQAAVTTRDGVAVDTFWVTGRNGKKLDAKGEAALREAFAGREPRRRLLRRAENTRPAVNGHVTVPRR